MLLGVFLVSYLSREVERFGVWCIIELPITNSAFIIIQLLCNIRVVTGVKFALFVGGVA